MTTRRITSRALLAAAVCAWAAGAAAQGWAGDPAFPEAPEQPAGGLEQTEAPSSDLDAYEEDLPENPADRKVAQASRINESRTDTDEARDEGGGFFSSVLQSIGALLLVLGFIYVFAWLVRKFGRQTPLLAGAHYGRVIGRLYLTPRGSLHFVRTGGRVLVVGVGPQSVTLLTEFDAETFAETAGEAGPPPGAGQDVDPAAAGVASFVDALRRRMAGGQLGEGDAPAGDGDGDAEAHGGAAGSRRETDAHMAGEIASLRGDIQRLQEFLRDSSSGEQR